MNEENLFLGDKLLCGKGVKHLFKKNTYGLVAFGKDKKFYADSFFSAK